MVSGNHEKQIFSVFRFTEVFLPEHHESAANRLTLAWLSLTLVKPEKIFFQVFHPKDLSGFDLYRGSIGDKIPDLFDFVIGYGNTALGPIDFLQPVRMIIKILWKPMNHHIISR